MNKSIKRSIGVFMATIIMVSILNSTSVKAVASIKAVEAVKAVPCSYSSITISWSKVTGATGYEVYKATSREGSYVSISAPTKTTFNSIGLETDKTYYYRVKSYKMIGKSKTYSNYSSTVNSRPYNYKTKFQNDVFVGDSITFNMGTYGCMNTNQLIAKGGARIEGVKDLVIASEVKYPKRVIIMCGVNNLGYKKLNTITFRNLYNDLIVTAKSKYPNAYIIVEPIFKTNKSCDRIRNTDVAICNTIIKSLANTNRIIFLDTSNIPVSSLSVRMADGLHFQPNFYPIWLEFIAKRV